MNTILDIFLNKKLDLILFEGIFKTIGYSCLIQILLKSLGMVAGYTVCSCTCLLHVFGTSLRVSLYKHLLFLDVLV